MVKIAHCSDLHLRLLKRHNEYRQVFYEFAESLIYNNVDVTIITGDVFHNKVNMSPEVIELASDFFKIVSDITPIYIIIGNHDCIINQPLRLDAISPIVDNLSLNSVNKIVLLKKSCVFHDDENKLTFGVFALNDEENFPYTFDKKEDYTNIALFHGALDKAKTDVHHILKSKYNNAMFKNYDIAMLGDIHKHQVLSNSPTIIYSGALLQQNHGEELKKGFVLWSIENRNSIKHEFVKINNDYGFYTIHLNEDDIKNFKDFEFKDVPKKPFIRVLLQGSSHKHVTLQNLASDIRKRFNPISLSIEVDIYNNTREMDIKDLEIDNVTQLSVQQRLIRKWFEDANTSKDDIEKILRIHSEIFNTSLTEENRSRAVNWTIHKMNFSNTYSYGEDNSIDFDSLVGLVGIFSPNRAGKSALLDSLMNGLFNMSSRVSRSNSTDLINMNELKAEIEIYFSVDNREFVLYRTVERQSTDSKRGRTNINLYEIIGGDRISLSGEANKNETEKLIRSMLGNYSDHKLTTFGMQDDLTAFLSFNQAYRKEVFSKFLGLDIVEILSDSVKAESDSYKRLIKQYKEHDFKAILKDYIERRDSIQDDITKAHELKKKISNEIEDINKSVDSFKSSIKQVDEELDKEKIEKDLSSSKETVDKTRKTIEKLEAELRLLHETKDKIENSIAVLNTKEIEHFVKDLADQKEKLIALKNSIILLKKDQKSAQRLSSNLKKHDWFEKEELCKKCTFLSDAFQARSTLENIEIQIEEKEVELKELIEKIDRLTFYEEKCKECKKLTKSLEDNIVQIKFRELELEKHQSILRHSLSEFELSSLMLDKYNANKDITKFNKKVKEEIDKLLKNLNAFDKQLKQVDKVINTKSVELGSIKQKIDDLDSSMRQLTEVEENFRLCTLLKEATSKDGIQLQIIKKVIPRINLELRKILSNAADFEIMLDIDKETSDLTISIDDGNTKRPLELGSGMEKTMGSIALRAAIANISLVPRCNLFVVDEGLASLDSENLNNINMLLGYLKNIFKTVIIISHVDILQDLCDSVITIKKDENGYSHLNVQ